jgi:UDP-perosamine 4-acetyltransferase
MQPHIIIIGAGGHARVLIEILRRLGKSIHAAVDKNSELHGRTIDGVSIVGGDESVLAYKPADVVLINAQGNVPGKGSSGLQRRRIVFETFREKGYRFMGVISPDAVVASTAVCDETCQVITGAIIQPGAVIGMNALINTGARIDHDCSIGAHSHIAPGTTLCGNVQVGPESHVGAAAVVIPGISIGAGAIVGAGSVVVADVAPGQCVMGSPAHAQQRRNP